MPWAKLDDAMWGHPKFIGLSNAAVGLWTRGLSYSAGHLTDGVIPSAFVDRYCENGEVEELVSIGLWRRGEGVFQIHDYADYQPSSESVKKKRRESAERMRKVRKTS